MDKLGNEEKFSCTKLIFNFILKNLDIKIQEFSKI